MIVVTVERSINCAGNADRGDIFQNHRIALVIETLRATASTQTDTTQTDTTQTDTTQTDTTQADTTLRTEVADAKTVTVEEVKVMLNTHVATVDITLDMVEEEEIRMYIMQPTNIRTVNNIMTIMMNMQICLTNAHIVMFLFAGLVRMRV